VGLLLPLDERGRRRRSICSFAFLLSLFPKTRKQNRQNPPTCLNSDSRPTTRRRNIGDKPLGWPWGGFPVAFPTGKEQRETQIERRGEIIEKYYNKDLKQKRNKREEKQGRIEEEKERRKKEKEQGTEKTNKETKKNYFWFFLWCMALHGLLRWGLTPWAGSSCKIILYSQDASMSCLLLCVSLGTLSRFLS